MAPRLQLLAPQVVGSRQPCPPLSPLRSLPSRYVCSPPLHVDALPPLCLCVCECARVSVSLCVSVWAWCRSGASCAPTLQAMTHGPKTSQLLAPRMVDGSARPSSPLRSPPPGVFSLFLTHCLRTRVRVRVSRLCLSVCACVCACMCAPGGR